MKGWKKQGAVGCGLGLALFLAGCGPTGTQGCYQSQPLRTRAATPPTFAPQEVLVRLKTGALPPKMAASSEAIASSLNLYKLQVPSTQTVDQFLTQVRALSNVDFAEPNWKLRIPAYSAPIPVPQTAIALPWSSGLKTQAAGDVYAPNDPNFRQQWDMEAAGVDKAWSVTKGDPNLIVAILDSGVDPEQPDLKPNLLPLVDQWAEDGFNDAFSDGRRIYEFTGKDGNGHGTHVAGIIGAAMDNGIGISGVAGGGVKLLPIKIADHKGDTNAATLAKAISRAVEMGARVINVSIGGPAEAGSETLQAVCNEAIAKGVTVVSVTGNESARSQGYVQNVGVPGAYPGVIAVAGTTQYNKVADYSNGGPETFITAPGGGKLPEEGARVISTWPTYTTYVGLHENMRGPYAAMAGTSMAAPHVTGIIALMLAKEPGLTPKQVRDRLGSTADDIDATCFDPGSGWGRVNAYRALLGK